MRETSDTDKDGVAVTREAVARKYVLIYIYSCKSKHCTLIGQARVAHIRFGLARFKHHVSARAFPMAGRFGKYAENDFGANQLCYCKLSVGFSGVLLLGLV